MSRDRFEPGRVPSQRPGKSGGKRDRNRQERTQVLCDAALGEFLARGIERVTVDEITKAAGVAKGSFYRYFEDKEQVVDALFQPLGAELAEIFRRCRERLSEAKTADDINQAYGDFSVEMGAMILRDPRVVRLYLQECRGPKEGARAPIVEIYEQVSAGAVDITRAARQSGLLRDLPPQLTALAVVGAVEGLLLRYLDGVDFGDPAEATRALVSMVLDGVRMRPDST